MKLTGVFLLIVFTSFLVTPAIITISDHHADVSSFFSMSEEENLNKLPQANFAFVIQKTQSNIEGIQFLKEQKSKNELHFHKYKNVFLDIISPPPRAFS